MLSPIDRPPRKPRGLRCASPLLVAALAVAGAAGSEAEAAVSLSKPANNTTIRFTAPTVDAATADRLRIAGMDRLSIARQTLLTFTWTATNVGSTHFIYGCLQRSSTFLDGRYDCQQTVASWSGNSNMRAHSMQREKLRSEIGNTLYWSVRKCMPYRYGPIVVNGQRYLCDRWPTPRSLRIVESAPIGSTTAANTATWDGIRPAFQASSCTTCHAIGTTTGSFSNQLQQVQQVVPAHPVSSSVSTCAACHNNNVVRQGLPGDVLNIAWHSAPTGRDFRGKSSAQLCQMAKADTPSAPSVLDHLRRDPLILWAVTGGPYPTTGRGPNRPTNAPRAFSSGISGWRNAVAAWVQAGMPCP